MTKDTLMTAAIVVLVGAGVVGAIMPSHGSLLLGVLMFIALGLYIAPSVIAFNRQHLNRVPIFVLNLLLGWTLIGWVGALVWSLTNERKAL
jgi:hypothetical protein